MSQDLINRINKILSGQTFASNNLNCEINNPKTILIKQLNANGRLKLSNIYQAVEVAMKEQNDILKEVVELLKQYEV